ncbi:hypothetical protein HNQ71_006815 [Mesorhizobium sangaii]|uniref:Uncharacterized protein n=1 Tax=Mesorhizobium sangaii TaxID=505389 RepID=A0A841PG24_9HYPH|nr:hypothetical protein [Mesorhizobium sangaii]
MGVVSVTRLIKDEVHDALPGLPASSGLILEKWLR